MNSSLGVRDVIPAGHFGVNSLSPAHAADRQNIDGFSQNDNILSICLALTKRTRLKKLHIFNMLDKQRNAHFVGIKYAIPNLNAPLRRFLNVHRFHGRSLCRHYHH